MLSVLSHALPGGRGGNCPPSLILAQEAGHTRRPPRVGCRRFWTPSISFRDGVDHTGVGLEIGAPSRTLASISGRNRLPTSQFGSSMAFRRLTRFRAGAPGRGSVAWVVGRGAASSCYNPTSTDAPVDAVLSVVNSATDDYFVLYVPHDVHCLLLGQGRTLTGCWCSWVGHEIKSR